MGKALQQLSQQLLEAWKHLGISQRISVLVTAVGVIAGLTALMLWASRPDYGLLYGKLDDAEAARVVAALQDAKVPCTVGAGGHSIYVPSDKIYTMRMQLASKGIPKSDGVGFEIFDKPNFGISDFVQRANYLRALQGELARTIGQLDQIDAARVLIVLPENRLLLDRQKQPTASVFVRVKGGGDLTASAVQSIQFLVANSVEGLRANSVTVVDNRGNVLSDNSESDSVAGLTAGQLGARRSVEQYLSQKAQGMLEKVLGPGQAVVRVAVEVNTETINRTEEKFDPEGQTVRQSNTTEENSDATTANAGGVAGVAANASTETNANAVASNNTHTRKKTTNNQYEINKSSSAFLDAPGGIKRISAAVFIASKYDGTGADRKSVARSAEELEKLRKIVQSALGIQTDAAANRKDEITLEEMPFSEAFGTEVAQQMDQQQKHQLFWDIGKNIGYVLLALAIMFIFLRTLKRTPADLVTIPSPASRRPSNGHSDGSVVTAEVLNRLLRENPDNMMEAVRGWMKPTDASRD
jgi:flagellar M-ring protein FliF